MAVQQVIGAFALKCLRWSKDNYGHSRITAFYAGCDFFARYIIQRSVQDDRIDARKLAESLQRLPARMSSENVEFSGFEHQLACGDALRRLGFCNEK